MEKDAGELESLLNLVGTRYRITSPILFREMLPERSNSSRKRKTPSRSLFYSPRPPSGIVKCPPKLEIGAELKGDFPVRRRTCKCKRSCCLKMYCWCFASGMNCDGCSCCDCQNTVENGEARQAALASILERNSKSLRKMIMQSPKLSVRSKDGGKENFLIPSVGCCCKRSHCIQGYCECYHANKFCSESCKCKNCENVKSCKEISSNTPKKSQDKEKFHDANREDLLSSMLGQSLKTSRQATPVSLNFNFRSLLADINLPEFCKSLIVTSEAVKTDFNKKVILENLGHEQELPNAVAFEDDQVNGQDHHRARPGDHLSGVQADAVLLDLNSGDIIPKERPVSQKTVASICDEKNILFTPDASSSMIQNSGCFSEVYVEQENQILVKFLNFLTATQKKKELRSWSWSWQQGPLHKKKDPFS